MLRRPPLLWLVSIGLILAPLYYYFEQALVGRASWLSPAQVIGAAPALKLGAALLAPPVGVLLLRVHPSSWYAMLGYVVYTVGANALLYVDGHLRLSWLALFLPTGLAAIVFLVRREIMSPFFNPRLRGWETDRVRFQVRADVGAPGEQRVEAKTWDISPSGVYVAMDRTIDPGTPLALELFVDGTSSVTLTAEAVWSSPQAGERPKGVGMKFDQASEEIIGPLLERVLRRGAARLPFKLRVDIVGKETIASETFDISRAGCYLTTEQPFQVGEELRMTLHLDGPLDIVGTVVRLGAEPPGVGVRFATSPLRLRAALRDFHARNAQAS